MKNKKLWLTCLTLFLMFPLSVNALSANEVAARTSPCEKIELAEAKSDGSLENISCHETYDEAKNIMNTTDNDNLIIIESGTIIDAKYALIDYDIDYPSGHKGYIDVYYESSTNSTSTYIHGGSPDEAAMLEINYATKRVKIKIAGVTGWINKYDGTLKLYDIVPIIWAPTPQYYIVTSSSLVHYFPGNIFNTKGEYARTIGRKPSMLTEGKYYSYDGNYFYADLKTLLKDYQNNTYENAVNSQNPFYNYYQYLSFRTKTNYTTENLNEYLAKRVTSTSKMLNTGASFIDAQEKYGINAVLMLAIGMNESGAGTSTIAQEKNNLFGLNAIDQSPGVSANYFTTVEDCIRDYAFLWLSYGYSDPEDSRFYGSNLGNKSVGANVKYASDPFWAEKAASYYYALDSMFGFQDYDSYQLAILNNNYTNTVYAKKTPGGDNVANFYQYDVKDSTINIIEEVTGLAVNGSTIWYKIQSDAILDTNLNYISYVEKSYQNYYWDTSYVYVPAIYFTKINQKEGTTSPENPSDPTTPTYKAISSIVSEANYRYESGNISGIKPGTSIELMKHNLTTTGGVITITDANGNTKESGNIGTGDKVNITSGVTETLTVLIYGDTNGDGNISAVDYVKVKNHIMASSILTDIYLTAADVNQDKNVSAVDYVNIKNYIMETDNVIKN